MILTSPVAPVRVTVNINTADLGKKGVRVAEHLDAPYTGPRNRVAASVDAYVPYWDGPVPEPADPRDWAVLTPRPNLTPKFEGALDGLRSAIVGADLTKVPYKLVAEDGRDGDFATIHLSYVDLPAGLEHLKPYRDYDGNWSVPLRTSLNDLFADKTLAPIVEAAHAAIAAGKPIAVAPRMMVGATPVPTSVIVNVTTAADRNRHFSQQLATSFAPGGKLDASEQVYDPLWDGPVPEPVDPRNWYRTTTTDATPRLAAVVAGLRDAIAGADLSKSSGATSPARERATVHMYYDERPVGLDHLQPREYDGTWMVMLRTSVDDLLVDPQLTPILAAANDVLAAAR